MAIKLEKPLGPVRIARVYPEADPAPMAPFSASFVLEWEGPRTVWIKAFKGELTRVNLRELLQLLVDSGIHRVLAYRVEGRLLPGGIRREDGVMQVDVQALAHRLAKPGASNWVDLDDNLKDPV